MEEIQPKYNLNIHIDNVFCDPDEHVSCPQSIIIIYGTQVFKLKNHNVIGRVNLEVKHDKDMCVSFYVSNFFPHKIK